MSFSFEILDSDKSILLIVFEGKLDGLNLANEDARFFALLSNLKTSVVLDFTKVTFMSSLGIRMLIIASKDLKRQGLTLKIDKPSAEVREVFYMTGLSELLM